MFIGRLRLAGLLVLVFLAASCTAEPGEPDPDAAVASYTAPRDAPAFCDLLADSTELPRVPTAIGALAADLGSVEARLTLTGAIVELRAVQDDVRDEPGYGPLETALDDLVAGLTQVTSGPLTTSALTSISSGLAAVGERTQPVCRFPA